MDKRELTTGGTALVTGANSGIGFETAYQLEAAGYKKVILGCRTLEKGETARKLLIEKGSKDVFETIAVDVSEPKSALFASDELISKGYKIDLLILNAGMSSGNIITKNSAGVDMTFASTLVGHHVMTVNLVNKGGFSKNGKIIIAGSEAARGDVPGMGLPDLDEVAQMDFNGNMYKTLKAYAEATYPDKYVPMKSYALAKLFVAWWASSLSSKLPNNITVNAVSPGAVTSTNFGRDMSWPMRNVVMPMMKILGPLMGMDGPVSDAAKRYLDVSSYNRETSGKFFASRPKKLVGKLEEQHTVLIQDEAKQEEGYNLIVELSGGFDCMHN